MVKKGKVTIGLSQMSQKYTKDVYMIKFYDFFEIRFLKCKCGILKRFNTQNGLLSLVKKMLLPSDRKNFVELDRQICQEHSTASVTICL